ncbi:MAG: arsenosugar biosynthesis radical SAM protein ArsS [Deltaproteobacteria bacterium]|nr:arsenosugar biosynthesis radical SAM protein ArsS [Deltaproteobacteria bacterium]
MEEQLTILENKLCGIRGFDEALKLSGGFPLLASGVETLQVNVGYVCNLACKHCHVGAGPGRAEVMTRETMESCLGVAKERGIKAVDITGGAPEMNPEYRWFVKSLSETGCRVMTRTNLSVLMKDDLGDIPGLWADNNVEVIASLPYYLAKQTDRVRGQGVFEASIEALKILNSLGYGIEGSSLKLNLVYNPGGAFMPPSQNGIEADFRHELLARHGVRFHSVYALTNMPLGRFYGFLESSGNLKPYMERLAALYNAAAANSAMCRSTVSVGWDGALYDCDFNQMLGLRCDAVSHIEDFDIKLLSKRRIRTGVHCYGCTAGAGSSCTGEVA